MRVTVHAFVNDNFDVLRVWKLLRDNTDLRETCIALLCKQYTFESTDEIMDTFESTYKIMDVIMNTFESTDDIMDEIMDTFEPLMR